MKAAILAEAKGRVSRRRRKFGPSRSGCPILHDVWRRALECGH
jgi:hypothetical protein